MPRSHRQRELPDLAPLIVQALLDPMLSLEGLLEGCDVARHCGFGRLCVPLSRIQPVRERLGAPGATRLDAVIAFPFGTVPPELKLQASEWAAEHGADALSVVPSMSALIDGNVNAFAEELAQCCAVGLPVTVILDMNRMVPEVLGTAVEAAIDAGAAAVQSGNGFGGAATGEQIRDLVSHCRGRCGIQAAGGIHTLALCEELLEAGATALGTSSGPQLLQALRAPIASESTE